MSSHNDLGSLGEKLAADYLRSQGYCILEQNFYYQRAEIDIIAQYQNTLIIVEVKTRNSSYFGDPQNFITPAKIKLLVKAADAYIQDRGISLELRFDVIAVLKNNKEQRLAPFLS